MAAIIDGSTYKGFWRIVSDSVAPNEYFLLPKANGIRFDSGGAAGGAIYIDAGSQVSTDADTIDENGNALNTSAKVAQYLSDNR